MRVYIALLFLVFASLACTEPIVTPTPTGAALTITAVLPSPTYLPTIPVTIWTHTPAPSGSGKAQP